jgi:2-oxoisovalerate dehydrogenase E1 component
MVLSMPTINRLRQQMPSTSMRRRWVSSDTQEAPVAGTATLSKKIVCLQATIGERRSDSPGWGRINPVTTPHDSLDAATRAALAALSPTPPTTEDTPGRRPMADEGPALFDAMAASRHLDLQARRMRDQGRGHYTISSAGHESNALIAAAARPSDPALLHYRSGGFYLARSLQAGRPLTDGIRDVLAGMLGSSADPASGGRHKVFGHPDLAVIPQTSTIASHLPRAVGVAFAVARAHRLGLPTRWPADAVAITSLGDASLNHSTATGALNTAGYCVQVGLRLPLVIVCEDNGLGISVPTPAGWVAAAAQRPNLVYLTAAGDDPARLRAVADEAVQLAREDGRPVFVHLRTVRFLGHAGTDVESAYREARGIADDLAHDPLLALAGLIPQYRPAQRYAEIAELVAQVADELTETPTLTSIEEIVAPLAPRRPDVIARDAVRAAEPSELRRDDEQGARLLAQSERTHLAELDRSQPEAPAARPRRPAWPEVGSPVTLAQAITATLAAELAVRPELLVFGEDVGRKGGVYGLTRGLQQRFRSGRVFDTLLDEQSILGLGLGLGLSGLLPVPEIQYLAYLHNAEDQLRGEAASLRFFSAGAFSNPMVVRVPGLAYQKGFGGHFHNDNSVAVLRDIPGLVVAVPSRPEDAPGLLRSCLAAASSHGQVSVFLEPIALYHERDLHAPGDGGWLDPLPAPDVHLPIGRARTHGDGRDLTIATFGNGLRMSLRVAARLAADGIGVRVLDLRWLAPLPIDDLLAAANATGRVLIADETRRSGGVSEGLLAALIDRGYDGRAARVTSADSYIPLGDAAAHVLLSEQDIEAAARRLTI